MIVKIALAGSFSEYILEILFDTFNVLGPDAEQPAEVSADERAGVEDEGGAVEAEVDVGGDGHHQGALVAVQVLQKFAQYSRIYQDTNDTMINGLLNMRVERQHRN